jgi:hypothetical protein
MISTSTVFQVRFWCRFCMWSCVHTHTHKTVTVESQTTLIKQVIPVFQVCSLTTCPQEPSIHRTSFTHFTLVLESIHTCQGREHSLPKRPVETSVGRFPPTHKPAHQSQYSVHDSLLQLLKTNRMISTLQLSFKSGFGVLSVCGHVSNHTHTKPSPLNHKRL